VKIFIDNSNILFYILLGIFVCSTAIQLFYYLFFYIRLAFYKEKSKNVFPPVSVVICARDEAENLQNFLPLVLNQNYREFEVVVVNDCSEDESEDILKYFQSKYKNLKCTTIKKDDKFVHGKKLALTIGIKAAKYDTLVFTDADCYPVNELWLQAMVSGYSENTDIVLGYGAYKKSNGFLNKIIRYDTFIIAMQYLSASLARLTYMGVGRNLSYKKDLFFRNKGFANHARLVSGDDDLFINEASNKKNTQISISGNSITLSLPKQKFKNWVSQKKRHRTTFKLYKFSHKIFLTLEPITRILFYLSFVLLLFTDLSLYFTLSVLIIRTIVQMFVIYFTTKKLNEKDLLLYSPIFDVLFIFIGIIIYFSPRYRNINEWR